MSIPKVFISYSHDSQEHKKWVLDLATRLRNTGVDATLDQWDLQPGDDLPHFMERNLASADRIVMVCTDRYVEKANSGSGGVGYEKMIITSNLLQNIDKNKVIPIIRQNGSHDVPTFLKSKLFIDFSKIDGFEFAFDELIRSLHGAPLFKKPEIGNNPFVPVEKVPAVKTADALNDLMQIVIDDFEKGHNYSNYAKTHARIKTSRLMFDMLIRQAEEAGLIRQDITKDLLLSNKGKAYCIANKLVDF
ncbi:MULTISPECIES: toll/interleukin-1 receptor domain-containing protein [unclassified Massilia]|uniref:toll/interleukin-1 receptor domain-containing protein n=1 Tax=unclassified Massilia TaxID=2609279 RepID=UPI0017802CAE|nr:MULTISPECIES: toll/interleukin-1 receptor domain-containing protein [unclassified Massilia]MBD8533390.1 toll/interleukin-1 receptor domain-containing protein [Massilia sp. CFBP 13647]MBD8676783.1 toll/interleukin-1 receptor domain-containing protein [Massilia sp. CFBP 13721]